MVEAITHPRPHRPVYFSRMLAPIREFTPVPQPNRATPRFSKSCTTGEASGVTGEAGELGGLPSEWAFHLRLHLERQAVVLHLEPAGNLIPRQVFVAHRRQNP